MDKISFTNLVKRYLRGEADEEERRWLDTYDKSLLNDNSDTIDEHKAASLENEISDGIRKKIEDRNNQPSWRLNWSYYRIAAIILLSVGLSWLLFFKRGAIFGSFGPVQYSEVHVPHGEIKKLKLEDGTEVTLNAGSRLRYPNHFEKNKRQVWLRGEGFFNVTKQEGKPFTINTDQLQINVLGTRFNVSAYADNPVSEVSVVEGKVSVLDLDQKNEKLLLLAGDRASYISEDKNIVKSTTNEQDILAWQQGQLNFKNETFRAVAAALERRYAVKIQMDKAIEDCHIYANIGNEPVEKALQALAIVMQAKLSGAGKDFRFSGKQCY